jgi:hypothetical protein
MMRVLEWITVPLSYPFMQRAFVASVIVGAVVAARRRRRIAVVSAPA